MSIKDRANRDIQRILANSNEYNPITFLAPTSETVTITGIDSKTHLGVDTDGNMVNSKKATISVSEKSLTDLGYPTRNANSEVDLIGHIVTVKDSTGIAKTYIVQNIFPDETIGLITCTLEDYE